MMIRLAVAVAALLLAASQAHAEQVKVFNRRSTTSRLAFRRPRSTAFGKGQRTTPADTKAAVLS